MLAALLGALGGGAGSSCKIDDTDYCATRDQCPFVQTDMGSVQLLCHPTHHVCIGMPTPGSCFSDDNCRDYNKSHCDTTTNTCVACSLGPPADTSCAHLTDRHMCATASDGSGTTLCVACQVNKDCPFDKPICDNQLCRLCASHGDCEGPLICDNGSSCTDSQVCIQAGDLTPELVGRCAQNGSGATGRVVYVNSIVGLAANSGTDPAMPLEDLPHGLTMAQSQGRRFIRLVSTAQKPLNPPIAPISDGAYSFIGAPTKAYPMMASVQSRGTLFKVIGTGSLTLDQLNLMQINMSGDNLVTCIQSQSTLPSLTLRRNTFIGNTPPNLANASTAAVSITNCNTLIDGNIIGVTNFADLQTSSGVHGTAITINFSDTINTASYLIQNNVIAGNAGDALNLLSSGVGKGKFAFRFNTVINNGRGQMGMRSAVYCPNTPWMQEFSHSIIVGNSLAPAGTQFFLASNCNLKDIVVGTKEMGIDAGFGSKVDPDLSPDFRLHTTINNSACCIDKVTPVGSETLPAQDIDGITRPQGAKWDIGASEMKQ